MVELECKKLNVGYDKHEVLKNVNFKVESGDYLCIVGENGSGKSTLMKTILSLQKPISGSVIYGRDVRTNQIGYLPQQTEVQKDFPASVYEIVLSGCLNGSGHHFFYTKKQKELARHNMELMEITSLANKCYRELSGGQQQRVLLARALCASSKMLLLDEPVAGLDPMVTREMYSIINKLNKKDGLTIIMISHDIPKAVKYASRILLVGKPCFFGTTEEFLASDQAKKFSLETED